MSMLNVNYLQYATLINLLKINYIEHKIYDFRKQVVYLHGSIIMQVLFKIFTKSVALTKTNKASKLLSSKLQQISSNNILLR